MKTRIVARGIAIANNKLLAVRQKRHQATKESEWWCLPGGTVEVNEDVTSAIHREMLEETGVKPDVGELLYVHEFMDGETRNLEFFFRIKNPDEYKNIDLSKTTHGEEEIAEIAFISPNKVVIMPQFLQTEDLKQQFKMPTKIISYV